mmetsp:Transcript_29972/g.66377  ORF Transcript_29972/g.66377 Transcript_29972/m.66377 type:complete len:330 (-) Transcript_29972:11-1000(-)
MLPPLLMASSSCDQPSKPCWGSSVAASIRSSSVTSDACLARASASSDSAACSCSGSMGARPKKRVGSSSTASPALASSLPDSSPSRLPSTLLLWRALARLALLAAARLSRRTAMATRCMSGDSGAAAPSLSLSLAESAEGLLRGAPARGAEPWTACLSGGACPPSSGAAMSSASLLCTCHTWSSSAMCSHSLSWSLSKTSPSPCSTSSLRGRPPASHMCDGRSSASSSSEGAETGCSAGCVDVLVAEVEARAEAEASPLTTACGLVLPEGFEAGIQLGTEETAGANMAVGRPAVCSCSSGCLIGTLKAWATRFTKDPCCSLTLLTQWCS